MPRAISTDVTQVAVRAETAKPMPCAQGMTAVLMPTTSPRAFTSGPPELPGLMAASVWSRPSNGVPLGPGRLRSSALTMPSDTLRSKRKGFPMATTSWPTAMDAGSASGSCTSEASDTCTTARSVAGSEPTSSPFVASPPGSRIRSALPLPATWWLVRR